MNVESLVCSWLIDWQCNAQRYPYRYLYHHLLLTNRGTISGSVHGWYGYIWSHILKISLEFLKKSIIIGSTLVNCVICHDRGLPAFGTQSLTSRLNAGIALNDLPFIWTAWDGFIKGNPEKNMLRCWLILLWLVEVGGRPPVVPSGDIITGKITQFTARWPMRVIIEYIALLIR